MIRLILILGTLLLGLQTFAADCGQFRVVKGNVQYKQKSKNKFRRATINRKICRGDSVLTKADSRAKIVMDDKNEINISPETELIIENYVAGKKAVLNVIQGKVRSNVKNKYQDSNASHFRVKTKSAVAGVRGTEFLTSFDSATNESRVVTFEGVVSVGRIVGGRLMGQVNVKPGQYTSNSVGKNPHPAKEVPPQEFAQMDQESRLDDINTGSDGKAPASTPEPSDDSGKDAPSDNGSGSGGDATLDSGGVDGPSANLDGDSGENPYRDDDAFGDPKFDDGSSDGGDRDVASVGGDGLGLPPPELNDLPEGDDLGGYIPPVNTDIGMVTNPTQIPTTCLTCNDAIINQKVKVIIVPRLPGTTQ